MGNRLIDRIRGMNEKISSRGLSWLQSVAVGSLYRVSDVRTNESFSNIKNLILTMRALAQDSQISTALSYYATDATTTNASGDIIWASPIDDSSEQVADLINDLFRRMRVSSYARDHILELATVGNLYIPTSYLYKERSDTFTRRGVVLDNNTIPEPDYDIIPAYKIPPDSIIHLWHQGEPKGFLLENDDGSMISLPESACIHFTLGGVLGDYYIDVTNDDGEDVRYDIQFANPLMVSAIQPTQTLSLLEDATVLSSLSRTIKFLCVECGSDEEEMESALLMLKNNIEQNLSLDTNSGDVQSYVNPQSPNNLIYMPKINGVEPISVVDLNMGDTSDSDSKLLEYYQDKKLSVLGVPKEAMNFSSNEGLGGAGSVLSQRSALYANALQRLETAYIDGWTDAINKYFIARNMSGFCNRFVLNMNPIITTQSTVQSEKRDSALSQASSIVDLLRSIGVDDVDAYRTALVEALGESFPRMGSDVMAWDINNDQGDEGMSDGPF